MKTLLILSLWFAAALSLSSPVFEDDVPNFDMDEELSPEDMQKLEELLGKELALIELNKIKNVIVNVLINDYVDKVLGNVQSLIIKSGMDPTTIPDLSVDIGIGTTDLTQGQLNDTSTIQRYENATLSYDNASKQLIAKMVVRFQDLKFIYKYHTKITFISMTGHLHGDIEHIHINVNLGFDFTEYRLYVDSINFKHTGDIKLTFSGNAAIDWITNAMSTVLTFILHDLILNIVKNLIESPIDSIVDAVNQILHPTEFF